MMFRVLLVSALVLAGVAAEADFRTVRLAYEVQLTEFQPPATVNGRLLMRECRTCDQRSLRVTANTRYELNHQRVGLAEFKRALLNVRNRDSEMVIVLHHLESDTVTAVTATL